MKKLLTKSVILCLTTVTVAYGTITDTRAEDARPVSMKVKDQNIDLAVTAALADLGLTTDVLNTLPPILANSVKSDVQTARAATAAFLYELNAVLNAKGLKKDLERRTVEIGSAHHSEAVRLAKALEAYIGSDQSEVKSFRVSRLLAGGSWVYGTSYPTDQDSESYKWEWEILFKPSVVDALNISLVHCVGVGPDKDPVRNVESCVVDFFE